MYKIMPVTVFCNKSEHDAIADGHVKIHTHYDKNIHDKVPRNHHCHKKGDRRRSPEMTERDRFVEVLQSGIIRERFICDEEFHACLLSILLQYGLTAAHGHTWTQK
jgi:hypothetical protein